ncbi:MAG: hypothetical protein IH608_01165 [Proteobacteria bacterium]|nr:hypothetical protein [Pseudomonadota bacterium]
MDSRLVEAWLRLTADALRGTGDTRKALEALGANPLTPEGLAGWARAWMPKEVSTAPDPGELQELIQGYWKALGVVPRQRHLELLERYEELKARLEETESTVKNLRELLGSKGREREAEGVLGEWEDLTQKALKAQAEWARTWTEGILSGSEKKERT